MSETSSRSIDTGRSGKALFIALVVVSYVTTFGVPLTLPTPLKIGALIAAGILYTVLGLYGSPYFERFGSPWALFAHYLIQIALGATIIYLSEVRALLIMLPLAGDIAEMPSRRWAIAAGALNVLASLGSASLLISSGVGPDGDRIYPFFSSSFWEIMQPIVFQYLLAFTFVLLFTRAAVREREARTESERLTHELRDANRQLRAYAAQIEELATVHERNRLAREIHDGLGHYLTGINMQIQAGRAVLDRDRDLALDAMAKAQALAQEGLTEVRRSVATLRASPLDNRSLPEAIEILVDECRAAGIATGFAVEGTPCDLSPQVKLALYRVAQEGMTNMCRHAQASSAEVVLDYRNKDRIQLTVSDAGVGSDDPSGGYGLVGVRERVHLLRGTTHIETAPGEGFTLKVEVPATLDRPGLSA